MTKNALAILFVLLGCIGNTFSQDNHNIRLQGNWLGKAELGTTLRLVLKFTVNDTGIEAL